MLNGCLIVRGETRTGLIRRSRTDVRELHGHRGTASVKPTITEIGVIWVLGKLCQVGETRDHTLRSFRYDHQFSASTDLEIKRRFIDLEI